MTYVSASERTRDVSGCQERVCVCHDDSAGPMTYFCSSCGCKPRGDAMTQSRGTGRRDEARFECWTCMHQGASYLDAYVPTKLTAAQASVARHAGHDVRPVTVPEPACSESPKRPIAPIMGTETFSETTKQEHARRYPLGCRERLIDCCEECLDRLGRRVPDPTPAEGKA